MTFWFSLVLAGWLSGGLANYLADVLPHFRRPVAPVCVSCRASRPWQDYLWPRPCATCGARPGWWRWGSYLLLAAALGYFGVAPGRLPLFLAWLWALYFAVVVLIDLEHRLVLHPVSWFGAGLGLVSGTWLHGIARTLAGGAAGYGAMWLLYVAGAVFLRWVNRRRESAVEEVALGYGDVNLSGVLGLLLGWPGIVAGLVLGILLGGVFSLMYLLTALARRRYAAFTAIPYAPFLVVATVILIFR